MQERMTVHLNGQAIYDIMLEQGFDALEAEVGKMMLTARKCCIVTDSNVERLYLEKVKNMLTPCFRQVDSFVFPAGEEHKNLSTVRDLYESLILKKYDRSDMLIALGGGVVGDLCGFAASTYLRGVSFIQIPTTLLSQVDSSIGGKTGVDFDSYKNMVGAFHMPSLVYTNVSTLLTLPDEQFSSGMGEIIKHGLIKDRSYYHWLSEHAAEIWQRQADTCLSMIAVSDKIKRQVVENDPMEKGERGLLNFGHTLGHAIEKLMNFQMLHGHCVGLGCLAAACISAKRGYLSMTEVEEIREMFARFHLPVTVSGLDAEDIIAATKNDKKMDAGTIKFILLKSIGEAYIDKTVSEEEMRDGLSFILR